MIIIANHLYICLLFINQISIQMITLFRIQCAFFFALPSLLFAQQEDSLQRADISSLETPIENITEHADAEIDFSQLEGVLDELKDRPVNLNSTNENELRRLVLINEQQISNLLAYIAEYGQVASIYELQVIEGFNQEIIEQLAPYISLTTVQAENFKWKNALRYGHPEILTRYQRVIETQQGYWKVPDSIRQSHPNEYYCGSPDGIYIRFLCKYRDRLQYGLVAEKDAGETLFSRADSLHKGFDFYSAHFYLNSPGKLKHLAVGDYHIQFGQGLTLWTGMAIGKAAGMIPQRKRAVAVRPHSSANETTFMRGIAATYDLGKLEFTGFYSSRKRDANLVGDDTLQEEDWSVSSLQEIGYHRTQGELADMKKVKELIAGGHVSFNENHLRIGITGYHINHNRKFTTRTNENTMFQPSLTSNSYIGVDYSYSYKRLTLYGEGSLQFNGGFAQVHGISFTPDPRLSCALVYRNYPINYLNPLSASFGEGGNVTNEKGLYFGLVTTPIRNVCLTAYTDFYRYPWLHYRVDAPSTGQEYSAQLVYSLGRAGSITFRYRHSTSAINKPNESNLTQSVGYTRRNYYQWQLKYQALPWLLMSNKVYFLEKSSTGNTSGNGFLISQDIQVKPIRGNWVLSSRYALFDTDSYDTRMYAYENDVPNAFSVPSMSGKGSRYYLMIKFRMLKKVDCWVRYSRTYYSNVSSISDGPAAIQGNTKSDVHLMLKIKF
jgi:hypothetical protein